MQVIMLVSFSLNPTALSHSHLALDVPIDMTLGTNFSATKHGIR